MGAPNITELGSGVMIAHRVPAWEVNDVQCDFVNCRFYLNDECTDEEAREFCSLMEARMELRAADDAFQRLLRDFQNKLSDSFGVWWYVVNTFEGGEPVQRSGRIAATSERDVVEKLKAKGVIDAHGYEFLELKQE